MYYTANFDFIRQDHIPLCGFINGLWTRAGKVVEDGQIGFKLKTKKEKNHWQIFPLERCLEHAEEISGLLLGVELRILIRAEAGRVELRGVSDPNDVVEEAEEEETDEWCQVEV